MAKKHIQTHTDNVKHGMGDYYGAAYKAKLGKSRENSMIGATPKSKLKKPPKTLA